MPDIRETLTRKIGPLPLYAWGAIVGGGLLVARKLTGGGAGSGGTVLGTVTDAVDASGGGGGSDGATQPPAGTGSTGTVGGNGSVRILSISALTGAYKPTLLDRISNRLPAGRSYRVEPVTIQGKNYWRILSTGAGATTTYKGYLIRRGASTYSVTTTQAA